MFAAVDLECIIISVRTTRRVDVHEKNLDAMHSAFPDLRESLSKSVTVDVVTYVIDEADYHAAEAAQADMEAADKTVPPAAQQLKSATVVLSPAVSAGSSAASTVDLNPYGRRVVVQSRGEGKRPHKRIVSDHDVDSSFYF
jgi:hypothetical protein